MENDPNAPQNYQLTPATTFQPPAIMQVPPTPQPPLNTPNPSRSKQRIIIAAVVVLLLLIGVSALVFKSGGQKNPTSNGKSTAAVVFKDWLKPSAEIKVGENRYVSACQVLPVSSVVDNLYNAKPPAGFVVRENYYDASPEQKQYSRPRTQCEYGDAAKLSTEQYFNAADTKIVGAVVSTTGEEYLNSKVAAYKHAIANSSDQGLKDFVSQIEASAKTYTEKKDTLSRRETQSIDTSKLIIPTGNDVADFTLFSNNVVYELKMTSKLRASDIANAPAEQVLAQLKQAKALIDVIHKNTQDSQLSQSPAPTIISDTVTKAQVGETNIVEPCAVLTSAITKSLTGIDQANAIERRTLPYNLGETRKAAAGYEVYPSNQCLRTVRQGETEFDSAKTTIQLEVEHAPNAAALDKKLKDAKFLPLTATDTKLQTNADFAAEFVPAGVKPYYYFLVGNYWCYLHVITIDKAGTIGTLSREEHVAAINQLVDSLKANVKQAESTQGR